MITLKKLSLTSALFLGLAIPAFAGVVVNSPANGATVSTPFSLSATATTCSSQTVSTMGYSIDSGGDVEYVSSETLQASVSTSTGSHTLHVKAWGNKGAVCVTDVSITVTSTSTTAAPSNATVSSSLQTMSNWKATHDSGTPGTSTGAMAITNSPSLSGSARSFYTTYTYYGGERYQLWFGDDTESTNFLYDTWIYIKDYAQNIANIEMDLNQVMPNGQTVIFGFQCDGWTGTWDYTANKGTPTSPSDQWVHSSAPCNVRQWTVNTWHHVQIRYSRNDSGYVTYQSVTLDGKQQGINATVLSAFALGWSPTLLTNFQVDGSQSGSASSLVYMDNLTISRW